MNDVKQCSEFIRWVTCLIPLSGSLLAGILIIFGDIKDYKCNEKGIINIEDEFAEN